MTTPRPNGNTVGIARGIIDIQLDRLQRQRRAVIAAGRDMGRGIQRGFRGATNTVNTFNQSLDSSIARLQSIQGELLATAGAGAALTGLGLNAADNLRNLQVRYRELAGDQERGLALFEEIAEAAQGVNLPVRETQASFAGLIPAIRDAGGEVDDYINLVARLRTLNPAEGTEGAVFAIREALASGGTDLVSLAERFNLPRSQLRALIDETGDFATALDIALNQQGATNEALESFSGNLQTARTRLQDAATRGLERAFNGQLDTAINLTNSLASGINAIPDGLLQVAGTGTTALATVTALSLGFTQALQSYRALQASGALTGTTARAGAAGLIAAGGVAAAPGIATQIARFGGRVFGNERLANQTNEDTQVTLQQTGALIEEGLRRAGRALQQSLFLITNAVLEQGRNLARTFALQVVSLATFPQQFDRFVAQFDIASGRLLVTIGTLIQRLSDLIPGADFGDQADSIINAGQSQILAAQERIDAANDQIVATQATALAAVDALFDNFIVSSGEFFGVIERESDRAQQSTERNFRRVEESARRTFDTMSQEAGRLAENVREALGEIQQRLQFQTELNRLSRDGTVDGVQDRIAGLEDERAAIEALLPELEEVAGRSDEAAQALDDYRSRLEQIDTQIGQLASLTPQLAARELDALTTEFRDKISEIESERSAALSDLSDQLTEDLAGLDSQLRDSLQGARREEIEAVQAFQEEEAEILEAHQERLLQIERRGREDIIDAAGRLDAAGVFAARRAREQQAEEAEARFDDQREQNAERLEDTRENLSEERQEILANYQQRRSDLIAAFNAEQQTIRQRYQNQIAVQQQAFNQEANILRQALNNRLNTERQFLAAEQRLRSSALQAMLGDLNRFASAAASTTRGLASRSTRGIPAPISINPSVRRSTSRGISSSSVRGVPSQQPDRGAAILRAIAGFNTGGVARFNGSGEALAFVQNKERILTPQQTASFDRLVDAVAGSAGAPAGGGAIDINLTGAESLEDIVIMTARQTYAQMLRAQAGVAI